MNRYGQNLDQLMELMKRIIHHRLEPDEIALGLYMVIDSDPLFEFRN